jgi:hypothetical protein
MRARGRAGHGSVRAGFGPFGKPTYACRVWKFPTRGSSENMKNRRVSGGLDQVFLVGLLGSGQVFLVDLQQLEKNSRKESRLY